MLRVRWNLVIVIMLSVAASVTQADEHEFEGQQFLFLTEDAYTQEEGEWQVSFVSQYSERKRSKEGDEKKQKDRWQWITEIEYGLTDRLQFEVGIPFAHVDKKTTEDGTTTHLSETGISDIETGMRLKLFDEDQSKWWSSTVSAGFGIAWPSGRWRKDLGTDRFGWETNLAMSKTSERWAYHLAGGFGMVDGAREQGESGQTDIESFEVAGALVYRPAAELDILCELFAEFEEEKSGAGKSHETEFYVAPGFGYEWFENFDVGMSVPIGLTDDSYDWQIMLKVQYEW